MGLSALSLIQSACYELNVPAPSSLVGATDALTLQLLNLFYATGRDLRQKKYWPQLSKAYFFTVTAGQKFYSLPQDFFSNIPRTQWDQSNKWEMLGPMTNREWNYRLYGYVTTENRKAFRSFGSIPSNTAGPGGQFQIDPTPNSTTIGTNITYEYISGSWLSPANWAPSTSYAQNSYVNNFGYIYKNAVSGSHTSAASGGPTLANGVAMDGGIFWQYRPFTAWAGTTAYSLGDYVSNGGNYYLCIGAGTSAGSGGPIGTSQSITDGTVTWENITVSAWAQETTYGAGAYVTSNSNLYLSTTLASPNSNGIQTAVSGKVAPNWTATTQVDNAVTWTWYQPSYDTLVADTDTSLFDDAVMISGIKWRFLQARGTTYEDQLALYDQLIETSYNRFNPGRKISLSDDGIMLAGLHPRIPEGNFG